MKPELILIQHILQKLQTANHEILSILPTNPSRPPYYEIILDDQHIQKIIEVLKKTQTIFQIQFNVKATNLEDWPEYEQQHTSIIAYTTITIDLRVDVHQDKIPIIISKAITKVVNLDPKSLLKYPSSSSNYRRLSTEIDWSDPELLEKINQAIQPRTISSLETI